MKTKNQRQITKINNYRFPYGFSNNKYNIKLSNLLSYQNLKDRKTAKRENVERILPIIEEARSAMRLRGPSGFSAQKAFRVQGAQQTVVRPEREAPSDALRIRYRDERSTFSGSHNNPTAPASRLRGRFASFREAQSLTGAPFGGDARLAPSGGRVSSSEKLSLRRPLRTQAKLQSESRRNLTVLRLLLNTQNVSAGILHHFSPHNNPKVLNESNFVFFKHPDCTQGARNTSPAGGGALSEGPEGLKTDKLLNSENAKHLRQKNHTTKLALSQKLDPSISFLYREISEIMPSLLINNWGGVLHHTPSSGAPIGQSAFESNYSLRAPLSPVSSEKRVQHALWDPLVSQGRGGAALSLRNGKASNGAHSGRKAPTVRALQQHTLRVSFWDPATSLAYGSLFWTTVRNACFLSSRRSSLRGTCSARFAYIRWFFKNWGAFHRYLRTLRVSVGLTHSTYDKTRSAFPRFADFVGDRPLRGFANLRTWNAYFAHTAKRELNPQKTLNVSENFVERSQICTSADDTVSFSKFFLDAKRPRYTQNSLSPSGFEAIRKANKSKDEKRFTELCRKMRKVHNHLIREISMAQLHKTNEVFFDGENEVRDVRKTREMGGRFTSEGVKQFSVLGKNASQLSSHWGHLINSKPVTHETFLQYLITSHLSAECLQNDSQRRFWRTAPHSFNPSFRIRHIKTLKYFFSPPVYKGSLRFKKSVGASHPTISSLRITDIPRILNADSFSTSSIRVDKEWKDQFIAKQQFKFLYGTVPQISTNLGDHTSRLLSSTSRF